MFGTDDEYGQLLDLAQQENTGNLRKRERTARTGTDFYGGAAIWTESGPGLNPYVFPDSKIRKLPQALIDWDTRPVGISPYLGVSLPLYDEVIIDEARPPLKKGQKRLPYDPNSPQKKYRYVYHYTQKLVHRRFALQAKEISNTGALNNVWDVHCLSMPIPTYHYQTPSRHPSSCLAHEDVRYTRGTAVQTMIPKFRSDFDLSQFIWELKDFKELLIGGISLINSRRKWTLLEDLAKKGRKLAGNNKQPTTTAAKAVTSVGSGYGISVNAFLSYNLAYAPLIQDCKNLAAAMQFTLKALIEAKKAEGEKMNSSYSSCTTILTEETDPYFFAALSYGSMEWFRYTAYISYKYEFPFLGDSTKALAAWMGVDLTAQNIWDMIPMSFLLDYVLRLGNALKFLDKKANATLIDPMYGESVKLYSNVGIMLVPDVLWTGSILLVNRKETSRMPVLFSGAEISQFYRTPAKGFTERIYPRFHRPKTKQKLIAAAIAINMFMR